MTTKYTGSAPGLPGDFFYEEDTDRIFIPVEKASFFELYTKKEGHLIEIIAAGIEDQDVELYAPISFLKECDPEHAETLGHLEEMLKDLRGPGRH